MNWLSLEKSNALTISNKNYFRIVFNDLTVAIMIPVYVLIVNYRIRLKVFLSWTPYVKSLVVTN